MRNPFLSVAAAQVAPDFGNVEANVQIATDFLREAAGQEIDLLVFPELSLIGYDLGQLDRPEVWITADDERLAPLRQVVVETGIMTIVGGPYRDEDGVPRLSSFVLHPDGSREIVFKMHIPGDEQSHFIAGPYPPKILELNGWNVAIAICFDAANPQHAMAARAEGADVYVDSALYVTSEIRRMDLHFASRAMDHRMFSLLANHAETGPGWESCGRSGTWGPDGEVRVTSGVEPRLVIDRLPYADLERYRLRPVHAGTSAD